MSATAFQRARREAAATMRAAAESVQEEQELNINENNNENEGSTNDGTTQEENLTEQEPDIETNEEDATEDNTEVKDYTVAQLKAMCDEKGIECKARATKAELIELLGM